MRSKLVAIVVAGLVAAPLAHAQSGDVTLYGRLNVSVEAVTGKQSGAGCPERCPNPTVFRVSSNSSMFGLRGSEPLGGGLNAIFQVESQVSMDTGGGVLAGRESFIGLQAPWGTVRFGNFLAPYDDILPIFGNVPTLTTSILSTASLWAQGYLGQPINGGFDDRLRNSVRYDSPTLSGFNGSVQYATAEGVPRTGSHSVSLGAFYNNGPVQLGVAYESHNRIRGTAADPLTDTALSVAGGYQFPGVRIGGVYERLHYDVTASTDLKRDFWGVSTTVDAGPGLIYAFWGRAANGRGSAADGARIGGLVKGENTGAQQWELTYTYLMSGRTLVYTGFVKIRNNANASYTFNSNLYPITCGAYPEGGCGKPAGLVLGMVHFF
jgi:predicted porin